MRPEASTEGCLDVLCAVVGGKAAVRALVVDVSDRRAKVLGVVGESARRAELVSMAVRAEVLEGLRTQRTTLRRDLQAKAHPAAMTVWSATEHVRKELVATGARKPEWVKEHLPSVERPTLPSD